MDEILVDRNRKAKMVRQQIGKHREHKLFNSEAFRAEYNTNGFGKALLFFRDSGHTLSEL